MSLIDRMQANVRTHRLLKPGARLLVAVSGGADSMALLHLLHRLAPGKQWSLAVAHLNHQLRGQASRADERLVRNAARQLRLPCRIEVADVKSLAKREKISVEMAARVLRHDFLARAARAHQAKIIALAHHADDQIELFLLRLLRGAGSDGLAGMRWIAPSPADEHFTLIRPLLNIGKTELLDYARAHRIAFRTDTSNNCLKMDRNRIRRRLLPLLEREFQPNLTEVLGRAMTLLADESECLDQLAGQWLEEPVPPPWKRLPVALQRRSLQRQLRGLNVEVDFDLIETLRLHSNQPVTVRPGLAVQRQTQGRVQPVKISQPAFADSRISVAVGAKPGQVDFGRYRFAWSFQQGRGGAFRLPARKTGLEWFDARRVGTPIVLRHWQPGDRFQPIGMKQAVKLQDLLTNAKIPRARRRSLILAATSRGEIWWVQGLRIGERFKLRPGTQRRLRWSWKAVAK